MTVAEISVLKTILWRRSVSVKKHDVRWLNVLVPPIAVSKPRFASCNLTYPRI